MPFFTMGEEFTMEPIVYNGNVTSMQNYRYKRTRECMSDSVNKASKVIESFSVTMTLNLTSSNDDVTGTRHTYNVLIRSLLMLIKTLKQSLRSELLSLYALITSIYYCRKILFFPQNFIKLINDTDKINKK